jgi:hypothetical protein
MQMRVQDEVRKKAEKNMEEVTQTNGSDRQQPAPCDPYLTP